MLSWLARLSLPGTSVPGYRLCRPFGTRMSCLSLPGTSVPGYRLCRPFGTRMSRLSLPSTSVPGYRLCRPFGTRMSRLSLPSTSVVLELFVGGPTIDRRHLRLQQTLLDGERSASWRRPRSWHSAALHSRLGHSCGSATFLSDDPRLFLPAPSGIRPASDTAPLACSQPSFSWLHCQGRQVQLPAVDHHFDLAP